jgi:hypothetical protein
VRATVVLVCTGVAVLPLLLLNGQYFTNALISLLLFSFPIGICSSHAFGKRTPVDQKRTWRLVTMLMVVVAISILASMPPAYRRQQNFNELSNRIRQLNEGQRRAAR